MTCRHRHPRVARTIVLTAVLAAVVGISGSEARAQSAEGSAVTAPLSPIDLQNPLKIVSDAADALPGFEGGLSSTLNILILMTVLTLVPSILILCTCFIRIVVVLGLLRQALGTQTLPPGQVITGLALFMTFMVMAPTMQKIQADALGPLSRGEIDQMSAWVRAKQPLRDFMFDQIERTDNWGDVYLVLRYRGIDTSRPETFQRQDVDMISLVPSFILSELKTAFLIGFRIYLPFLIIDMVIASLLISMGMMMLPPVLISLPFKLVLFVLVDGWRLVAGNLLDSFATSSPPGLVP
ncbi:MAG: flagellar type III secretion system pore protein FliP [Phycisphaerae bacterium]|nr:flagellar type III secretion system pore protein FliP [Phycisphaerae bacterium]